MSIKQRTPRADFDDIPGDLPNATVPPDADLTSLADKAVLQLNSLQQHDLAPTALWRDLLALTDNFRTFNSASTIYSTLQKLSAQKKRSIFRIKKEHAPRIGRSFNGSSWIDVDILFTAQHGKLVRNCMGTVSIMLDGADGNWKIWMLRTWLECFDGFGHPDVIDTASINSQHEPQADLHTNGTVTSNDVSGYADGVLGAVIIGAGQAGLAVGGRLKALGVSYAILEKHREVGDVWGERYESLRWHTTKEYGSLPFGHTYLQEEDKCLPIKRIKAGQMRFVKQHGINVILETAVESAKWDDDSKTWTISASRPDGPMTLKAKNLVFAIGPGHATPVYPSWATADKIKSSGFKGTIVHSFVGYHSAHQWAGKRGIVIGTANTAFDVAEDMANAKMETTMVQRNPTFVFLSKWLHAAQDAHYNAKMSPAEGDRESFTYPNKVMRQMVNAAVHGLIKMNPAPFDDLEAAGFKLDRYGDIYNNLYVRFGGHYVDIGGSERVAKGEIKMKGEAVKGLTEDGLVFEDGSEVGADLIVLCTGFDHDFRNDAARILGQDVADQVDNFFGLDEEGELRGHARPSGHPSLYYQGGDVRMARFFSQFIALQIQADVLGEPMQPYRE